MRENRETQIQTEEPEELEELEELEEFLGSLLRKKAANQKAFTGLCGI